MKSGSRREAAGYCEQGYHCGRRSSRQARRSSVRWTSGILIPFLWSIALQNQHDVVLAWKMSTSFKPGTCFVSPFLPRCIERRWNYSALSSRNFRSCPTRNDPAHPSHLHDSGSVAARGSAPSDQSTQQQQQYRPIPPMPSPLFSNLAQSQLELLAHALRASDDSGRSKIGSMALYLPQENVETGQLEFLPAVLYPHPSSERVFIAPDADSGMAPTLPKTLTTLPGFAHAATLLPGYPMVSSSDDSAGVGVVEEVLCDTRSRGGAAALSVPLFSGSRTVGVLLVWPSNAGGNGSGSVWSEDDKQQISRAAQSLSLALSMETERTDAQKNVDHVRVALSDSLHQVKNPLQALRTFGKLLQQRVATSDIGSEDIAAKTEDRNSVPQLQALAQHLMVQGDRVADLLLPIDSLVSSLDSLGTPHYLSPSKPSPEHMALTPWQVPSPTPWRNETIESTEDSPDNGQHQRLVVGRTGKTRKRNGSALSQETSSRSNKSSNEFCSTTASSPPSTMVGDVELEMAFVTDVLEPILTAFKAIASESGVDFEVLGENEELPGVLICPKALQEAVSNVLDNAFKYVMLPKDGATYLKNPVPRVRIRLMANYGRFPAGVTIFIEDNGPGIRPDEKEAIFERGFRSGVTSSVKGTGIGLDISRSLLSRMGGILDVAKEGRGTLGGTVMEIVLFRQPTVSS